MRVAVLSSGSKGNSTLIESSEGSILIDAGLSGKKLFERLDAVEADIHKISAIIITHDHRDHISGAGIAARKLRIPVHIHKKNYQTGPERFKNCEVNFIEGDFGINGLLVNPFSISHDGTENYAYNIISDGKKICHLTDIGKVSSLVKHRIKGSDLMVLESNHDPKMLKDGPYPWYLKQRVSGNRGHLSNTDAASLISELDSLTMENLILAHLSEENNDPLLAFDTMTEARERSGYSFRIHTACQYKALDFIEV